MSFEYSNLAVNVLLHFNSGSDDYLVAHDVTNNNNYFQWEESEHNFY